MDDPRNVDILQRSDRVDPRFDNDEVHEHWRAVRKVLDSYPGDRMAVGEAWVRDDERLARYVRRDELQLAFNFHLVQAKWDADDLRTAISDSITAMSQVYAVATWVLSNHDIPRHVTRYGGGRLGERRARAAALLQLALPGVAYIYQGDELGLAQVDVPDAALQDPVWERSGHTDRGRDGCRVPIPWSGTRPPYGFSADSAPTWLPMPDGWSDRTVDAEDGEPDSMLTLYRRALQLRHTHPALRTDAATGEDRLRWLDSEPGTLAFARPSGLVCVVNASADSVALPEGELLLSSAPLGADATLPADTAAWLVRQR
jgi:alpha-glucosidase